MQTFAAWLEQEHSITPGDELRVAMYAHASNGGIKIDAHGATNIKGLFACGEATGGMHGADRLGGLSSANGLVFGRIAGASAAAFAERSAHALPASGFQQHNSQPDAMQALNTEMVLSKLYSNQTQRIKPLSAQQARTATSQLKHLMSTYAMINAQARD